MILGDRQLCGVAAAGLSYISGNRQRNLKNKLSNNHGSKSYFARYSSFHINQIVEI